ncbi:MAG: Cna B-type domain-containing protein [Oscillospiraceae bacterium]
MNRAQTLFRKVSGVLLSALIIFASIPAVAFAGDGSEQNTTVTVTADWIDSDDECGIRPSSLELTLLKDGETYEVDGTAVTATMSPDDSGNWTAVFEGLPSGGNYTVLVSGLPESYSLEEYHDVPNETDTGKKIVLRNVCRVSHDRIEVQWEDSDNASNLRPESITISPAEGSAISFRPVELTASTEWTGIISYPLYSDADSETMNFSRDLRISVGDIPGYSSYSYYADRLYKTIVRCTLNAQEYTVVTVWEGDDGNALGTRPESYSVVLQKDGEEVPESFYLMPPETVETDENTEKTTFFLPYTDSSGQQVNPGNYTPVQKNLGSLYTESLTGRQFTNTMETTSFTALVKWENETGTSSRPSSVLLTLYADGTEYGGTSASVECASGTGEEIQYTWTDLPKYDPDGNTVTYSVKERPIPNYTINDSESTVTASDGTQSQEIANVAGAEWVYKVEAAWQGETGAGKYDIRDSTYYSSTLRETYIISVSVNDASDGFEAGEAEIRVPYYLWQNRDGTWLAPSDISIPNEPGVNNEYSFYYSIDDNGTEDESDDEIVFKNWKTVNPGDTFTLPVTYEIIPANTIDLSKAEITASADFGGNTQTAEPITYTLDTGVGPIQVTKSSSLFNDSSSKASDVASYWQGAHFRSEEDENFDTDTYNYVEYSLYTEGLSGNQTAHFTYVDTPQNGGEVIAVKDLYGGTYDYDSANLVFGEDGSVTVTSKEFTPTSYGFYIDWWETGLHVLVRYPRNDTGESSYEETYVNNAQIIFEATDDEHPEGDENDITTASTSNIATWKDYVWTDYGKIYSTSKKFSDTYGSNSLLTVMKYGVDSGGACDFSFDIEGQRLMDDKTSPQYLYGAEFTDRDMYWKGIRADGTETEYVKMTADDFYIDFGRIQIDCTDFDSTGENITPSFDPAQTEFKIEGLKSDGTWMTLNTFYLNASDSGAWYSNSYLDSYIIPDDVNPEDEEICGFRLTVPDGVCGRMRISGFLRFKFKHTSPTIEGWLSGDNPVQKVIVQNFADYRLFRNDGSGNYYWFNPALKGQDTEAEDRGVIALDMERYGDRAVHKHDEMHLDTSGVSGYLEKQVDGYTDDTLNSRIIADCSIKSTLSMTSGLPDEVYKNAELADGTFYDLLPVGYYYLDDTASAHGWNEDTAGEVVSVETVNNYKETGRQLVIFHVQLDEDDSSYNFGDYYYGQRRSSITVSFRCAISWSEYIYYRTGYNLAAFYSGTDAAGDRLSECGRTDASSGFGVTDEDGTDVFYDINGDGDTSSKQALYGRVLLSPQVTPPVQEGIVKSVRGDGSHFKDSDFTHTGAGYIYRISYTTSGNGDTSGLIFYDILEEAQNTEGAYGETSWKGTFSGVDIHVPENQGIDVKVYYSTADADSLNYAGLTNADSSVAEQYGISNSSLWSLEPPEDLSDVTAVAFDLTTAEDGTDKVFDEHTSTYVDIKMEAPSEIPEEKYTYNRPAYHSVFTLHGGTQEQGTEVTLLGKRASVEMNERELSVSKIWDDGGDPEDVRPDSVTLQLYRESASEEKSAVGDPVTLTAANASSDSEDIWEYTWTGLAIKDEDGNVYTYTVSETSVPDHYTSEEGGSQDSTLTVTNTRKDATYIPCSLTLTAEKTVDGSAPGDRTFVFELRDSSGNLVSTAENDDAGEISFPAIEYAKGDIGSTYTYTVSERNGGSLEYTYDETVYTVKVKVASQIDENEVVTISTTVTYYGSDGSELASEDGTSPIAFENETVEFTELTVYKRWDDMDDGLGIRPDSVTVTLMADGEPCTFDGVENPVVITADGDSAGGWSYTWPRLPETYGGDPVTYSVEETGYTAGYAADGSGTAEASADGGLEAVIKNSLDIRPAEFAPEASKTVNGREPRGRDDGRFEFVLAGEGIELSASNDGGTVSFPSIRYTYEDIGKTFRYRVSERTFRDRRVIFDRTEYEITVRPVLSEITEDGKTVYCVEAEVSVTCAGKPVDSMAFNNIEGRVPRTGDEFDPALWFTAGAVSLVLTAALAVKIKKNKRRT